MRLVRKAPLLDEAALQRALARLREVLHARGLKMTTVREALARAALAYEGHFDVEELVRVLRANNVRDAHAATVYRALPLLVEAGLLQNALVTSSERTRFERAFEREHHDHLVCTSCKKVVEFHFEAFEVLQRDVAEHFGFALTDHVHELVGLCRQCRRDAAAEPAS
jgi:Fur family transcriptional regulator, ferric uptake regulator